MRNQRVPSGALSGPPIARRQVPSLATSPLFAALAPADVDYLLDVARPRRLSRGETLFRKGDRAEALYAIVSGRVRVVRDSTDGKEMTLRSLGVGDVFGELGLFRGSRHPVTSVADTECALLAFARSTIVTLLERNPRLGLHFMAVLEARIGELTDQLAEFVFQSAEVRLARRILELARAHGTRVDEGVRIDARVSQQDLANLVGVSRESVNKQLRGWEARGLVSLRRFTLTLHRTDELAQVADVREGFAA